MTRAQQITLGSILALFAIALVLFSAGAPAESKVSDEDQRPGLVSTAEMFAETSTYYPTGAEYVQAVYASQDIEITTDIEADSYSAQSGPMVGDIVVGANYYGIMTGETTAMGVHVDGGPVQEFRLTTEDVRRVDW